MGLFSILWIAPVAFVVASTAASPARADGPPDPKDLVRAELVAEKASIAPAATLWVDLHLAIKPGWHVYWRNPGDSGLPTTIDWNLPSGFSAGAISWPVPEHFVQGGSAITATPDRPIFSFRSPPPKQSSWVTPPRSRAKRLGSPAPISAYPAAPSCR